MRVAVVGSSTFPLSRGAGHILRVMKELPKGTIVLIRGRQEVGEKDIPLSGADAMVAAFAKVLELDVIATPLPKVPPAMRGWARDETMLQVAERVIIFFDPERIAQGGTGNVLKIALQLGCPVEAWTLDDDDNLERMGEA